METSFWNPVVSSFLLVVRVETIDVWRRGGRVANKTVGHGNFSSFEPVRGEWLWQKK